MWTSGRLGAKCLLVLMTLIALCWCATVKLKSAVGKLLHTRSSMVDGDDFRELLTFTAIVAVVLSLIVFRTCFGV